MPHSGPTVQRSSDPPSRRREVQLELPLSLPVENSQGPPTGIQLRFPWGKRVVDQQEGVESLSSREQAYLSWLFRDGAEGFQTSETKVNHLLFLAQPLSFYPAKLIREGRNRRARKAKWHTHGCT